MRDRLLERAQAAQARRDEHRYPATAEQVAWARSYPAYERIAADESKLEKLLRPGRNSYAAHGVVPDWCGVDYLRTWAFFLVRGKWTYAPPLVASELTDVLDALRRHKKAQPKDLPPSGANS